jgi:uncharacterized protein (DUF1800 family)
MARSDFFAKTKCQAVKEVDVLKSDGDGIIPTEVQQAMTQTKKSSAKIISLVLFAAVSWPVVTPVMGRAGDDRKTLDEDQKILHVLNRLGYGARPGDLGKVKAVGLDRYIASQLEPASISDQTAEAKTRNLEIFNMSTAEVFAKYPNPNVLLQRVDREMRRGERTGRGADEAGEGSQAERRRRLQEIYRKYDLRPGTEILPQIVANRVLRAVYSERQLQEVMVDFWQNHFNVFSGKQAVRWYIPAYERDVLRKHALGNFKQLLTATAQHPAMLFYLDNFESVAPAANGRNDNRQMQRVQRAMRNGSVTPQMRERLRQRFPGATDAEIEERLGGMRNGQMPANNPPQQQRRGINENYARELMELHTLGVDGGYTQTDIVEVAKAFSGWTIADPRGNRRSAANMITGEENRALERLQRQAGIPDDLESGEFYFNPRWHAAGPKNVLGERVNEGGIKDGLKVIDLLANHPSTARHIARKLAVKFVSDRPSDDLVERIAKAFTDSKGDIKSTLRAIFADEEFFSPRNYRSKIKTPFELAVSAIRTIGADTNSSPALMGMLQKLGEVPYGYQAPTGYPDSAENWVNTGALLERLNFAIALSSNRIPGTRANLGRFSAQDRNGILDLALEVVLDNDVTPQTRSMLVKQIGQPLREPEAGDEPDDGLEVSNMRDGGQGGRMGRRARLLEPSGNPEVFKIVSLVLGTPEFQRQ